MKLITYKPFHRISSYSYFLFLLCFSLAFQTLEAQSNFSIERATVKLIDSSNSFSPVYTEAPFRETNILLFESIYQNQSSFPITNLQVVFRLDHLGLPLGPPLGNVYNRRISLGNITANTIDSLHYRVCPQNIIFTLGDYKAGFKFYDGLTLLDSAQFLFTLNDTTIKKDYNQFNAQTGPSFFNDTVLFQNGGTTAGDHFATLFEVNNFFNIGIGYVPTSISYFIAADTLNIGAEILPAIWELNEDSLNNKHVLGKQLASSFIPIQITATDTGQWITVPFDTSLSHSSIKNGLSAGKYAMGYISSLAVHNGKSIVLGNDTVLEKLQPKKSSFVLFGQDSSWYRVDANPLIRLHLGQMPYVIGNPTFPPCLTVGLNEEIANTVELELSPNPTDGIINLAIANSANIEEVRLYSVLGAEIPIGNRVLNQVDITSVPSGLYLLSIRWNDGSISTQKVLKK